MAEHEPDYYAILGIAPDADEAAIRLAFRRLALKFHPDVAGAEYAERMGQINVAYRVLSNPERRRLYDLQNTIVAPAPPSEPAPPRHDPPPQREQSAPPIHRTVQRGGTLSVTPGPLKRVAALEHADATPIAALHLAGSAPFLAAGLLDGRAALWNIVSRQLVRTFSFDAGSGAGVLQDVRVSPSGAFLAAWGFQLGTRLWRTDTSHPLWNSAINGPNGVLDIALSDAPPLSRMALPDAPVAIADDDPFRWAHAGRGGTAIFFRPLVGAVDPAWAVPLRCSEAPATRERYAPAEVGWRVQRRMLSSDGARLLTVSTSAASGHATLRIASLWDLTPRGRSGAPQPRIVARIAEPLDALDFPMAASADLQWLAARNARQGVRLHHLGARRVTTISIADLTADSELALAPDGATLGIANRNRLAVWDARAGKVMQTWSFAAEVTALSCGISGDRACWVVGLANGTVEVWA